MASLRNRSPATASPQGASLRVSRFDQVSSFLLSLALFIGLFVGLLGLIWLTTRLQFPPQAIKPIPEEAAGRGDHAEGFERDFDPPGAEEIEELLEPTLQDTLEAVVEASTVAASLEAVDSEAVADAPGTGQGDSRQAGPEGEGEDIVPRFERWQLKFAAKSLAGYATQLDFYEIELAAIGGQIQGVDYATGLAGTPQSRRGESASEERLYFMWTSPGPLMQYDQQLLQQAGIPLAGRQMLKFIPPNLENQLAALELEYARENGYESVTQIAKTIFESRSEGSGFAFSVIEQRYRVPRGG